MSGQIFLLRDSPKEGVLRSIGAAPNGILGMRINEGEASWMVTGRLEPVPGGTITVKKETLEESDQHSVAVEIPDVVTACESPRELFRLSASAIKAVQVVIGEKAPERDWPTIRAAIDFLEDTLSAVEMSLHERGVG